MEKQSGHEFTKTKYEVDVIDSIGRDSVFEVEASNIAEARRIGRNLHILENKYREDSLPTIETAVTKKET